MTPHQFAKIIDSQVAGELDRPSWGRYFTQPYRDDVVEAARREVVSLVADSDGRVAEVATKCGAIATRLRASKDGVG